MNNQIDLHKQILQLCQKIYPSHITEDKLCLPSSTAKILLFAEKNRLIHFLALEQKATGQNQLLQKSAQEYRQYQKDLYLSLDLLSKNLKGKQYLVIKTFSSYPHTTSDLDVLVKNASDYRQLSTDIQQKHIVFPVKTDINLKISWTTGREISDNFVWSNTDTKKFNSLEITVPNPDLDVLIRLAHIPFELAEIRLGELLYIFRQARTVNWLKLKKEAEDNSWKNTYQRMIEIFNNLHHTLYHQPLLNNQETKDLGQLYFPVTIPYWILIGAIIEKRAWNKIWGGRYILKDRLGL